MRVFWNAGHADDEAFGNGSSNAAMGVPQVASFFTKQAVEKTLGVEATGLGQAAAVVLTQLRRDHIGSAELMHL